MDIVKVVEKFIKVSCERQIEQVNIQDKLSDILSNSIEFVKLVVEIEEYFHITFENDDLDLERFTVVGDLISFIERKIETIPHD